MDDDRDIKQKTEQNVTRDVDVDSVPSEPSSQGFDTLSLQVPGKMMPIVRNCHTEITVGRGDPKTGYFPTIDLTEHKAHALGISREHAVFTMMDDQLCLTDLESRNGTFVNENRLAPKKPQIIRNGDHLRFGNFLCFAYLSAQNRTQFATTFTSKSKATQQFQDGVGVGYLVGIMNDYFKTLAEIQNTLDAALNRPHLEIKIHALHASAGKRFTVETSNGQDIFAFLRKHLTSAKSTKMTFDLPISVDPFEPSESSASPPPAAPHTSSALANQLIRDSINSIAEADLAQLSQRLKPLIGRLLISDLQVISVR